MKEIKINQKIMINILLDINNDNIKDEYNENIIRNNQLEL